MDQYYQKVESMLQVSHPEFELTGGVGRVIARGAEALRYSHGVLPRNAPDCDGQGTCAWGCQSGAKRSADVSYIPAALKFGAQLITSAKAENIIIRNGRAIGVRVKLKSGNKITVNSEFVVAAAGTLHTPGLINRGGNNLTIHPVQKVFGLFDEHIDMSCGIPQGYGIDELRNEGIMFEGGSIPLDVFAMCSSKIGNQFMKFMEQYDYMAPFGFLIEDSSSGIVYKNGTIVYNLSDADVKKIKRGTEFLCEVFFAAGAKKVYPFVYGTEEISSMKEFRKINFSAKNLSLTAYHPLGTCRMGDVCTSEQEVKGINNLFVADGSIIPTPLGVNPQMTIMALGHRAAKIICNK